VRIEGKKECHAAGKKRKRVTSGGEKANSRNRETGEVRGKGILAHQQAERNRKEGVKGKDSTNTTKRRGYSGTRRGRAVIRILAGRPGENTL